MGKRVEFSLSPAAFFPLSVGSFFGFIRTRVGLFPRQIRFFGLRLFKFGAPRRGKAHHLPHFLPVPREQRLPERPSQKEIHAALEKEAQAIRARIPKGAAVVAMCVEGRLLSSEALARQLAGYAAGGTSKVCFLVGGSFGLDEGLKREASLRLSMSPMTFPHHLARVMLAEQIYRACTINAGTQYHK